MLFNSAEYLFFLPIVVLVYYILPQKIRYIWLLIASYYFYMNWNMTYIFLILGCTVITYFSALMIEKRKRRKTVITCCTVILLLILGYFKYYDFFIQCMNGVLHVFRLNPIQSKMNILLPVGISFYTLQALGYVIDVYRGEIYAEKNFLKYALFISFFPQLVAGPIERSKNLLTQLAKPVKPQWDNFRKGILLILYGLFCKIVIADRIAEVVKTVYAYPEVYNGMFILFAAVLFSFQIYCDFYGYSTIARGSAMLLGITLTDNFNAPYYSQNVKEFWVRWHVSLSTWFKDYLYIPLGGNRKGTLRKNLNLFIVFAVSGLWHGAELSFVLWGCTNGIYQIIGSFWNKIKPKQNRFSTRVLNRVITFGLITFTWIFFAADSIGSAIRIIKNMITGIGNWNIFFDGSLWGCGIQKEYLFVLLVAIAVLLLVDYQKYRGINVVEAVLKQGVWFRIGCIIALVFVNILFGCYGEMYDTQQFIYFQF